MIFVEHVTTTGKAAQALKKQDVLLVSIPLTVQKQYIDKGFNKLIRNNLIVNKGRTARDPKKE